MSTTKEITIFIAEDHLIARMGLKMLLEQTSDFSVIGEAEDGETAVEKILELKPEVVMMDLGLPKVNGIEATSKIKKELPQTKILIFTTAEDDESVFAALKAGADGYCLKTISGDLLNIAIHSVLNGAAWLDPGIAKRVLQMQQSAAPENGKAALTASKLQLLKLVEEGKSLDEIAAQLKVNDALVKGLLNELLQQLKCDDTSAQDKTVAQMQPVELTIRPGETVAGHYLVEARIGHGGMGAVFQARHQHIERKVAIKTLHEHLASDQYTLARFKKEAEASASVSHPNLVTIFDFGILNERVPYIVMEFLDGYSLADLIQETGRLDEKTAIEIFAQVADALHAVHSKGIVHRDLKPSNIMLVQVNEGDPYVVKLVDFGIAKVLAASECLTQDGEAIGSPPYMSPEQCYAGKLDHRSDLYSLGCTMYEAFSGQRMFEGSSIIEVMMKHVNDSPAPGPLENARVSKKVTNLIMKLLEKSPNDRPSSASEVRDRLRKN